jgi:hypothetical protein
MFTNMHIANRGAVAGGWRPSKCAQRPAQPRVFCVPATDVPGDDTAVIEQQAAVAAVEIPQRLFHL